MLQCVCELEKEIQAVGLLYSEVLCMLTMRCYYQSTYLEDVVVTPHK